MGKVEDINFYSTFGWMKNHLDIKGYDLILYSIIWGFTQNGSEQKYNGSLGYLCEWTGLDKANVCKRLKSMTERGLLSKTVKTVNGVTFCEYLAIVPDCVKDNGVAVAQRGCCGSANNNKKNNKVSKDKSLDTKSDEGYTPEFEQFWKAYPKRNGKKQGKFPAFKSFLKIKTPLETLLAALELHKRSQQWADGYIPDAVTWLNQRRWEDEIDPSSLLPAEQKRKVLKTKINEEGEEVAYYEEP